MVPYFFILLKTVEACKETYFYKSESLKTKREKNQFFNIINKCFKNK